MCCLLIEEYGIYFDLHKKIWVSLEKAFIFGFYVYNLRHYYPEIVQQTNYLGCIASKKGKYDYELQLSMCGTGTLR